MSATPSMSGSSQIDLSYKQQPNCYDLSHIPGEYGLPVIGRTLFLF